MNKPEDIAFVSGFVLITLIYELAVFVGITYYTEKPIGMETLLDKVTVIFLKIAAITGLLLNTSLTMPDILGPCPKILAIVWASLELYLGLMLFLSLTSVMVTKCLSIYHGPLLAEIEDSSILVGHRTFLLVMPAFLSSLDLAVFSDIEDIGPFQQKYLGYVKPDARLGVVAPFVIFANFTAMIIIHIRIEVDNFRHGSEINTSWMKIGSVRTMVVLGFLAMLLFLFHVLLGGSSLKFGQLVFVIVLGNVIPLFYISNHKGMRRVLFKWSMKTLWFVKF